MNIVYPILSIGGLGVVFGAGLGIAGEVFKVDEDPKIGEILEVLPGANCGGCGFPGCGGCAAAIAAGSAPVNACPVGGVAVAEKVVRLEIFGVECSVPARNLSWEWIGDAREQFHVGDAVLTQVTSIQCNAETKEVKLEADMKAITKNEVLEKLSRCKVQGRYSGRVTDVHKGATFVKLDIGVNALAYSCTDRRLPGKHDDVSFVVTRLDQERGVAVGIITRITRQNI